MKVSTYETGATRPVCCSCDPEWECGFWEVVGDRFKPCPGKVFGSDLAAMAEQSPIAVVASAHEANIATRGTVHVPVGGGEITEETLADWQ